MRTTHDELDCTQREGRSQQRQYKKALCSILHRSIDVLVNVIPANDLTTISLCREILCNGLR